MAPAIAIHSANNKFAVNHTKFGKDVQKRRGLSEMEEVRRRNEELEREVMERQAKEEEMRAELERTRTRLQKTEEAEERLCAQLGEFEAEAVEQARECRRRVKELTQQLTLARNEINNGKLVNRT